MPISEKPYRRKTFATVRGNRMAYIEYGGGDAIVFQHGNPTSSYLWRNIMPYCEGLGRLIACDLIGMGDSDNRVIMVLHDWGSAMGFDWANRNRDRVQGIVYMEAIVTPLTWADWPENARRVFQSFRSESGEEMILEKNMFVERVLPNSIIRRLSDQEMATYRKPFARPGEDRRPTLTWPRMIPIEGKPADVVKVVEDYGAWLASANIPKLFINADPGSILVGRQRELCRAWLNQTEVTVKGRHFLQEDSPHTSTVHRAMAERNRVSSWSECPHRTCRPNPSGASDC
jgi:haloalkane dehalogenase